MKKEKEVGLRAQMSMVQLSNLHRPPLDVSRHFELNMSKPKFTCLGLCSNGEPEPLAASTAKKTARKQKDSPAQCKEDLCPDETPTARSPHPFPPFSTSHKQKSSRHTTCPVKCPPMTDTRPLASLPASASALTSMMHLQSLF